MAEVKFYGLTEVAHERIKYVVIAARYQDKWVFVRHKDRNTWEISGGHREAGEDPIAAARRELWEETGALHADMFPICIYQVNNEEKCGMLFFGQITVLDELPIAYEIGQRYLANTLPENLTYPGIQPALFQKIQNWLNLQSKSEELWDVYDGNRNLTGRTHRRGAPLGQGEYHLVVHVWLQNPEGDFLITKRSPNKGYPNMWESTGGSALAGDDSLTAAIREVKEETGLLLHPEDGQLVMTIQREESFVDVWLFHQNHALNKVVLQPGETTDRMYANRQVILDMLHRREFVPYSYLRDLFAAAGI